MDQQETIWLRGGPVEDKHIPWRGGDEVRLPYVKDFETAAAREQAGKEYFQYLLYRRSDDDPTRFDFVKVT